MMLRLIRRVTHGLGNDAKHVCEAGRSADHSDDARVLPMSRCRW